jgi:LysR family transcriptional regulator, regulator for bpeEF and oprC
MTLEQLRIFVKVVEAGSFSRAASVLGMQPSNVSRVMAQLEAELGVSLLERTTRKQSVTEAGKAVFERAKGVMAAIEDTVHVTQNIQAAPQGLLRVTCGVEFGMGAVGAWLRAYLARHPQVTVEVEYATRELDLVHEGFDLAIRSGPLPESRLVARKLGIVEYALYASPAHVQQHGAPASPAELAAHPVVVFTGAGLQQVWELHHPEQQEICKVAGQPRLRVNSGAEVLHAVLAGIGIGSLPNFIAKEHVANGRLVRVMTPWHPPPVTVYAVYPSNRYLTPKVRAFVDLASAQFPSM